MQRCCRQSQAQQLAMQTQGIFNHIEIKITPHNNRRVVIKQPVKENKSMSQKTAEQINEVAENAPPGLKEVLLRLAKHGKQ